MVVSTIANSVPSSFDKREHFDYNIASLTGIVINCSVSFTCNDRSKAWSPYSCNGRKHRCKHVSDAVSSSSDKREHFDYNIASLAGTVINCSVSSSCNDRSDH